MDYQADHEHVVAGVALGDDVGRLEGGVGELGNGELLVVGLLERLFDHTSYIAREKSIYLATHA